MKKLQHLIFPLLAAACFPAHAQVENTNFENWTQTDTTWDGQPVFSADQWLGGKRTEDSYSGNFAAKVEPYTSCGIARNYMAYGPSNPFGLWMDDPDFTGAGTPINSKPAELSGYFKFLSPQAEDEAHGIVVLKKFDAATQTSQEVGRGEITFSPSENYAPFTIQITDLAPGVMPDSIVIGFSSGMGFDWNDENGPVYGTLYVDQLRILKGNAFAGLEESTFESRIYPNPATDELHCLFETAAKDDFMLVLTDLSGRKIQSQRVEPGISTAVQIAHLPAAAYVITVEGKGKIYARTTVVKQL